MGWDIPYKYKRAKLREVEHEGHIRREWNEAEGGGEVRSGERKQDRKFG